MAGRLETAGPVFAGAASPLSEEVNGIAVFTLAQVQSEGAKSAENSELLTLKTRSGNFASATRASLDENDTLIRRQYGSEYVGMQTYRFYAPPQFRDTP